MSTTTQVKTTLEVSADDEAELPEGWAKVTVSEICEVNPPKPPADALTSNALVTFVPMPAVDAELGSIATPLLRAFSEVRKGFTAFRIGDVIMAKITPCMENGKAAVADNLENGLGFGSTEFHVFRSVGAVLPEFIYHFIRQESYRKQAESEMTGSVGQKRVPSEFIKRTVLGLPPLSEQERIVAKIEELLKQVNASRNRLAKVPKILKRFRQSALAAACSGRLTEDWRERNPGGDAARKLISTILSERKARMKNAKEPCEPDTSLLGDVPEEWIVVSMDSLTCLVTSGSRGWARFYSDTGPYFVRAENINTDRLTLDGVAHVRPTKNAEGLRTRIDTGDLLITITGANVTKSALVEVDLCEAYVSQHVALVRPVEVSLGKFLYLWTVSPSHGRAKLINDAYGAGKPGLNLENIKEMPIGVPSLEEQHEIVRRVEALFKLADKIEKRVEAATKRVNKLTQAILAKAFRGELVPTEAELARREGRDYEPASALLERIKAEREKLAITKSEKRPRRIKSRKG